MTATDKQAAIAALKKALGDYDSTESAWVDYSQVVEAARAALSALEADDGRAMMRRLRYGLVRKRDELERDVTEAENADPRRDDADLFRGDLSRCRLTIAEIDRLLAAEPAQSAEPAAPAGDDEALPDDPNALRGVIRRRAAGLHMARTKLAHIDTRTKPQLVTAREMADVLDVSPDTMTRLVREGRIGCYRLAERPQSWRYDPDEVLRALRVDATPANNQEGAA